MLARSGWAIVGRSSRLADSGSVGVAALDAVEAHDDVGRRPLGPDEGGRLRLPLLEVVTDGLLGVAPLLGVALDLPLVADGLGRVEVDRHVEAGPGQLGEQGQQALDDHELARLHQHRAPEGAVLVVVDGLEDGVAEGEQLEVLLHDVDVVAVGVERRERLGLALDPVVLVVVVDADRRDPVGAEGVDQALGDGGLAGRAVAGDGEHDGPAGTVAVVAPGPLDVDLLVGHGVQPSWERPAVAMASSARLRMSATAAARPPGCL